MTCLNFSCERSRQHSSSWIDNQRLLINSWFLYYTRRLTPPPIAVFFRANQSHVRQVLSSSEVQLIFDDMIVV